MSDHSSIEVIRKKIKFRAWHRGIREMDLILGQYIDAHIDTMTCAELDEFEQVMAHEDRDLLQYIMGQSDLPESSNTPMLQRIISYTQKDQHN